MFWENGLLFGSLFVYKLFGRIEKRKSCKEFLCFVEGKKGKEKILSNIRKRKDNYIRGFLLDLR